jgi:hypothetical protein
MLVYDVETTGVDPRGDAITMVCAADTASGCEHVFVVGAACNSNGDLDAMRQRMFAVFDRAPCLASYNGLRFDLSFIAAFLRLDDDHATRWALKTVDVFEALVVCHRRFVPLNKLAARNGVDSKISNGRHAVLMARQGQWSELQDYCIKDVYITRDIYSKGSIVCEGLKLDMYCM